MTFSSLGDYYQNESVAQKNIYLKYLIKVEMLCLQLAIWRWSSAAVRWRI